MEVKEIVNVMKNFIKDEDRAILFTGTWGIGKTYNISKFLRDKKFRKKNKYKYLYVSMFGKKNLDEVNTELYNLMKCKCKQVLNVISSVVKLLNISVSFPINVSEKQEDKNKQINITASISGNNILKEEKKKKKRLKKNYLIIIDDFERKSETIINDDFLGYIHGLILQGFKVVVLADLDNLYGKEKHKYSIKKDNEIYDVLKINWGDDVLGEYKEKIFDRIYNIDTQTEDVVEEIVGENKQYVIKNILELVDKNLRFVCKSNNLFNKVKRYIEKNDYKFVRYTELYTICCFVIIETMTNKYTKLVKEQENQSYNYEKLNQLRVIAFEKFIKGIYFFTEMDYINLIYAVIDVFESEKYVLLDKILSPDAKQNNPLLEESIFYLSDRDKEKKIKEQYEYLLKIKYLNKAETNTVRNVIKEWYRYFDKTINNLINEEELFKQLHSFGYVFHVYHDEPEWDRFVKRYNSYLSKEKKNEIMRLLDAYPSKDFNYDKLSGFLLSNNINENLDEFIKELKKHNFLISQIHGSIKPQDWQLAHEICSFFSTQEEKYKKLLRNYLIRYRKNYPDDKSLKERIDFLIPYFRLNEDDKK